MTRELVVPPTLQALAAARLDRLELGERSVLERPRSRARRILGSRTGVGGRRRAVAPRLAALVRKGLIRPERTLLVGEEGFRVSHQQIRDAAYDGVTMDVRARLHERDGRSSA